MQKSDLDLDKYLLKTFQKIFANLCTKNILYIRNKYSNPSIDVFFPGISLICLWSMWKSSCNLIFHGGRIWCKKIQKILVSTSCFDTIEENFESIFLSLILFWDYMCNRIKTKIFKQQSTFLSFKIFRKKMSSHFSANN